MAVTQPSSQTEIAFTRRSRNAAALFSSFLSDSISLGKEGTKKADWKNMLFHRLKIHYPRNDFCLAHKERAESLERCGRSALGPLLPVARRERCTLADGFSHTRTGTFSGSCLTQLRSSTELELGDRKRKIRSCRVEEWLRSSVRLVSSCFSCPSSWKGPTAAGARRWKVRCCRRTVSAISPSCHHLLVQCVGREGGRPGASVLRSWCFY